MANQLVRVSVQEGVGQLQLDSPTTGNALSIEMMDSIRFALAALAQDDSVRFVKLEAMGKHFCTGADLSWIQALCSGDEALWMKGVDSMLSLFKELYSFSKPVLAAIHGSVIGGGLALTCLCDEVIASNTAKWRLPELSLGIVPTLILPALIHRTSHCNLSPLLYSDCTWDSVAMLKMNLIDSVTSDGNFSDEVNARITHWKKLPPKEFALTKLLKRELQGDSLLKNLVAVRPYALASIRSEETRRRVQLIFPR